MAHTTDTTPTRATAGRLPSIEPAYQHAGPLAADGRALTVRPSILWLIGSELTGAELDECAEHLAALKAQRETAAAAERAEQARAEGLATAQLIADAMARDYALVSQRLERGLCVR